MSTAQQLQTNNKTFLGRHWQEHKVLRRYFKTDKNISILSFGCSTGEELLSLHTLFPNASLYGCDIDWENIQIARGLLGQKAIIFEGGPKELLNHGPFDIIVCNSVLLRHTTIIEGKKRGIDTSLWLDVVSELDASLKKGGILQIINSNIPFRYHPLSKNYCPLSSPLILGPNFVDTYDLEGRHLCSGFPGAGWSSLAMRHWGEEFWKELKPTDFADIHFLKKDGATIPHPITDEKIPNFPEQNGIWASGKTSYRPIEFPDSRPSTHLEIDTNWDCFGTDAVRIQKEARRIWFDGSIASKQNTIIDLIGPSATMFLESIQGQRSTRMSIESLLSPQAIQSPSF